jgi:fructose/tagatose bisphosphate aldolase
LVGARQRASIRYVPLATTDEYARMLDAASAGGYSYAAVNVASSETLNAALRGFAEAGADGIVQITLGAAEFLSGSSVSDPLVGARAFAHYAHVVAEASPVLVALHTDRCPPALVDHVLWPLVAESAWRIERDEPPLFHSHTFDGSTLPLEDALRIARPLLVQCSGLGIVLEVECGVGSSADELAAAVSYGAVKTNIEIAGQDAFTRALAGQVLDDWNGILMVDRTLAHKHGYDARSWGGAAEASIAARVREACEQLGSAGRTLVTERAAA